MKPTREFLWTVLAIPVYLVILTSSALSGEVNLAPLFGTASQSTTCFGGPPEQAIDGNLGNFTHTCTGDASPTWQVDLGRVLPLTRIVIWNRSSCCSTRLSNFRVTALDDAMTVTFTEDFFTDGMGFPDPSLEILLTDGTTGQVVRVALLGPNSTGEHWLSLAEVEVFGIPPAIIAPQPVGGRAYVGSCFKFEAGVLNVENPQFQWQHNEVDIPGATGSVHVISDVTQGDAGSYRVVVTQGGGGVLVSDPAELVVPGLNLALSGTASQSTTAFGGAAQRGNDGNTSGIFGDGSMTHTDNEEGAFWQVELLGDSTVERVVLWNRTECCSNRLSNFRLMALDAGGAEVFGVDLLTDMSTPENPVEVDFPADTVARVVRVQRLGPDTDGNNYMSIAECEVFGDGPVAPPDPNLAAGCAATTRQSSTLGGFVSAQAVDGNLGNFTHTVSDDDMATWEVDLGAAFEIGTIILHNRSSCCGSRLRDIKVFVLNGEETTFESELLNPENELGTFPDGPAQLRLDFSPDFVAGSLVRVTRIADPDLSGTGGEGNVDESNVLSLAEVVVFERVPCPAEGDTHCSGLTVEGPEGGGPGTYTATADASDDSDDSISYTFTAESPDSCEGGTVVVGPQASNTASFNLKVGTWTISVSVDDDPICTDDAGDATCSEEVVVAGQPNNVAPGGAATQSTTGFGGAACRAIDGITDGNYGAGSVTHTAVDDPAPFWEVDLLESFTLDRIVIWNRTDACCSARLSNFRVSLLDAARDVVHSEDLFTGGGSAGDSTEISGVRGSTGNIVRVELLGPGAGGDALFLSLAEVEVFTLKCPEVGDTTCSEVVVTGPAGKVPGTYTAVATAEDTTGDAISYTFTARLNALVSQTVGPQAENSAEFELTQGDWTISVVVDDDPACDDPAGTCSTEVTVNPAGTALVLGDGNSDGSVDLSDVIWLANFLFSGTQIARPCEGDVQSGGNLAVLDFNGDGGVDLSDVVANAVWQFQGGDPHPLNMAASGPGCALITECLGADPHCEI